MADVSVELPLYPDAYYSYIVALEEQSYELVIRWNERDQSWFFSLYLEDGTPLATSNKMVANYPILLDYSIPNLTGFFFLETISSEIPIQLNPRNLSDYYNFFYIYPSE